VLDVVNAGHNPGFLLHGKTVQQIGASGTPVGMLEGMSYSSIRYHLEENSRLLLYTDGLTEVFRGEDEFGPERLLEELRGWRGKDAEQLLDSVWSAVETFDGEAELRDDRTALAMLRQ
jgi:serine phosphatase RsbU (regulator of sigma subunit)